MHKFSEIWTRLICSVVKKIETKKVNQAFKNAFNVIENLKRNRCGKIKLMEAK